MISNFQDDQHRGFDGCKDMHRRAGIEQLLNHSLFHRKEHLNDYLNFYKKAYNFLLCLRFRLPNYNIQAVKEKPRSMFLQFVGRADRLIEAVTLLAQGYCFFVFYHISRLLSIHPMSGIISFNSLSKIMRLPGQCNIYLIKLNKI